jgi:hypothetical protein
LKTNRYSLVRDWIALVIILFAVPLSVLGGTNIACVGQGISSGCALDAVFISPVLLVGAGFVAGLITRGWTGLFVVGVGQILGQFLILLLSYLAGRGVPVDPFSGVIATVWFGAPIAIGYGVARGAAWIASRRKPKGDASA